MQEILNDGKNTDNVLNQSMGLDRKSYGALKEINKSNVKRLVPIWSTSLMNDWGELSAPAVYDGVIYAINAKWTCAIDVETGKQIRWLSPPPERSIIQATLGAPREGDVHAVINKRVRRYSKLSRNLSRLRDRMPLRSANRLLCEQRVSLPGPHRRTKRQAGDHQLPHGRILLSRGSALTNNPRLAYLLRRACFLWYEIAV
jgi:glucose dehydrogenase